MYSNWSVTGKSLGQWERTSYMDRLLSSGVVTLRARYVAVNGKCILINNAGDNIDIFRTVFELKCNIGCIKKLASIVVSINLESILIRYDRVCD